MTLISPVVHKECFEKIISCFGGKHGYDDNEGVTIK